MNSLMKTNGSKKELIAELVGIENKLATVIERVVDLDDERKALQAELKATRQAKRLKDNRLEARGLNEVLQQAVGAQRVLKRALKKIGIEIQPTKLDQIMQNGTKAKLLEHVTI